jgi:hypothetical protein
MHVDTIAHRRTLSREIQPTLGSVKLVASAQSSGDARWRLAQTCRIIRNASIVAPKAIPCRGFNHVKHIP